MSDFKSNEYANLLGGKILNLKRKTQCLVLGVLQDIYQNLLECFELSMAIKRVRNDMGLRNVQIMIPFIRTLDEAKEVIELLKQNDLESGKDDLQLL